MASAQRKKTARTPDISPNVKTAKQVSNRTISALSETGAPVQPADKNTPQPGAQTGAGILAINAKIMEPQTLVQLCLNQEQYLSPTGWTNEPKSTLLDSRYIEPSKLDNTSEGQTQFTLPASDATSLKNGDNLTLYIPSLGLTSKMVWATNLENPSDEPVSKYGGNSEREVAKPTPISPPKSPTKLAGNTALTPTSLLNRFRKKAPLAPAAPKREPDNHLGDIRRRADEARRAAEALEREMKRAHQAKQQADARVTEAARLAELASIAEQDRAKQVAKANKELRQAETAHRAEQDRLEAERLAVKKRAEAEAQAAAEKRQQAKKLELEQKRDQAIQSLTNGLTQQKTKIAEHVQHISSLQTQKQETSADIKTATQHVLQAQQDAERSHDRTQDCKSNVEQSQTALTSLRQTHQDFETRLNTQQKQSAKSVREISKLKNAHEDAHQAAQTALEKANALQQKTGQAEQAFHNLQADHAKVEQSYRAGSLKISQQQEQLEQQQSKLIKADQELTDHQSILTTKMSQQEIVERKNSQSIHQLKNRNDDLDAIKLSQQEMTTTLARLSDLSISTDNFDEVEDILTKNNMLSDIKPATATAAISGPISRSADLHANIDHQPAPILQRFKKKDHALALKTNAAHSILVKDDPSILEPKTDSETRSGYEANTDAGKSVLEAMADANTATKTKHQISTKLQSFTLPSANAAPDRWALPHKNLIGLVLLGIAGAGTAYFIAGSGQNAVISTKTVTNSVPVQTTNIGEKQTPLSPIEPHDAGSVSPKPSPIIEQAASEPALTAPAPKTALKQAVTIAPAPKPVLEPTIELPSELRAKIVANNPVTMAPVIFDLPVFRTISGTEPVMTEWEFLSRPPETDQTILPDTKTVKAQPSRPVQNKKINKTKPAQTKPTPSAVKITTRQADFANTTQTVSTPASPNRTLSASQSKLRTLGFYTGASTGLMDPATRRAISDFQSLFGMTQTGTLTPAFLTTLGQANIQIQPVTASQPIQTDTPKTASPVLSVPRVSNEVTGPISVITSTAATLSNPVSGPSSQITTPSTNDTAPLVDTIVEARKLNMIRPVYPDRAARNNHQQQATIIVKYAVGTNGRTTDRIVDTSTGTGRYRRDFERSALAAIKQLRFSPMTVNGTAIKTENRQTKLTYNPPR